MAQASITRKTQTPEQENTLAGSSTLSRMTSETRRQKYHPLSGQSAALGSVSPAKSSKTGRTIEIAAPLTATTPTESQGAIHWVDAKHAVHEVRLYDLFNKEIRMRSLRRRLHR